MPIASKTKKILSPLLIVLFAACATGQEAQVAAEAEAGIDESVAVRINNNLTPPTSLTVFIVPEAGARQRLGNVAPGETTILEYEAVTASGGYRLLAEPTAGEPIFSPRFTLPGPGVTVQWELDTNTVLVL